MSLHTPEAFTEKATSKSLAKTREEVVVGFGVIQTAVNVNTLAIATNKTNIATNATNIATNVIPKLGQELTQTATTVVSEIQQAGNQMRDFINTQFTERDATETDTQSGFDNDNIGL